MIRAPWTIGWTSLHATVRAAFGSSRRLKQRIRPEFETLEDRTVLTAPQAIFEATGANAAAIQTVVNNFRTALGTNNGVGSTFTSGRREINWDGTPDARSDPNPLPPNFFNTNSPRGVLLSTPGSGFLVSSNPGTTTVSPRFGSINPEYTTDFSTFSAPRLFTAVGSNITDVNFFLPGTSTQASVSGFGAVFTDVDTVGSTRIEFFDRFNNLIFSRTVLPTPGNGSLSFLGVQFAGNPVARVRLTSGNTPLGATVNDTPPTADVVVMDDFIYGEPQTLTTPAPAQIFAVGSEFGSPARVQVFTSGSTAPKFDISPFPGFTGGVRVAVADVTGDGIPDIIVAAGPGGGPHVRVFDGNTGQAVTTGAGSIIVYDPNFSGGVFVASADVDGDGFADIVVGADAGGGPHVKVFSGKNGSQLSSFFAYDSAFRGGVRVAAGNIVGDARAEIVTAPGVGGGPHVRVFDGLTGLPVSGPLSSFLALDQKFTGGIYVAAGDVNGDGVADIVIGTGAGVGPFAQVFNGKDGKLLQNVLAFDLSFLGGVRVGLVDRNNDGKQDLVLGSGPGSTRVRILDASTLQSLDDFFAQNSPLGGVYVS